MGICFDNRLKFNKQIKVARSKVDKTNSILKYLSRISRGVEVNTALMLYKSIVRSVLDYGLFVYAPNDSTQILKLERAQFLGIRTALGYRNSTPNNVIIAEAKVILLMDRARMLAKNFCSKIFKYGEIDLKNSLDNLRIKENYVRYRNPIVKKSIICEAWEYIRNISNNFGTPEPTFEVWKMDYEILTEKIEVDLLMSLTNQPNKQKCREPKSVETIIGYNKEDIDRIEKVKKKYNIQGDALIAYTDGSRPKMTRATGANVIFED